MKVGKADNIVKNAEYTKYYFLNLKYTEAKIWDLCEFELSALIEIDIVFFGMA